VNPAPLPLFHSSGQPGFSSIVSDDPRHITARKFEREVQVRFAPEACTVQTPEGLVHARAGDAIITGTAGEKWRVSRAHFANKYRPKPPLLAGEAGPYLSLRYRIRALQMQQPFEVVLADGESHLVGRAGDWLVDYGDGSLGIVTQAIFATTYEILP
jgi:PGDYG protein